MTIGQTRRWWLYGGVAAAAGLAGIGGAVWRRDATPPAARSLDASVWTQKFERPEGGEVVLEQFRGKPLIINFWATWCPPCVEEMPLIDAFFRENSSNGLQVVGLAIDQPSAVRKFLDKTPVSYPIGLAGLQGTDLLKQLGNTAGGLPFSLMIDANGSVAASKMGRLDASDLQAWRRA